MNKRLTRFSWMVLVALPALAAPPGASADRRETFGAVVAPAVLPNGGISAYGLVGAPDLAVGFREGFGGWELEARARLDYLQVSLAAELLAKFAMIHWTDFDLAPYVGLGFVGDTGTRYYDPYNFGYVGPRGILGAVATQRLGETVRGIVDLKIPVDYALGGSGAGQVRPSLGAGAEVYLGNDTTVLLMGQLGLDALKEPGGVAVYRLGWGIRLGIGFRLF